MQMASSFTSKVMNRQCAPLRQTAAHHRAAIVRCQAQAKRRSLFSSMSRVVEHQGLTTKYEVLAGRSAMLGTSVAIVVESLTEQSLLQSTMTSELFCTLALATVTAASLCAALTSVSTATPALLEPVITSLTAVKRSGSSITVTGPTSDVDQAVDAVVTSVFTPERLRELTDFSVDIGE